MINNAENILLDELPQHFNDLNPVPVSVLAEQAVYLAEMDDSLRRAEKGTNTIQVSGMMMTQRDRATFRIPRSILQKYPKRRSGSYHLERQHTYRRKDTLPRRDKYTIDRGF